MTLMKRDSNDYYRIVVFLIASAFLHVLVYFVADAASLFSPEPRSVKVREVKRSQVATDKVIQKEPDYINDEVSGYKEPGEAPAIDTGSAVVAGRLKKLQEAVSYVRAELSSGENRLEKAKEMYQLYEAALVWLEWILDKLSVFLVKLNI